MPSRRVLSRSFHLAWAGALLSAALPSSYAAADDDVVVHFHVEATGYTRADIGYPDSNGDGSRLDYKRVRLLKQKLPFDVTVRYTASWYNHGGAAMGIDHATYDDLINSGPDAEFRCSVTANGELVLSKSGSTMLDCDVPSQ